MLDYCIVMDYEKIDDPELLELHQLKTKLLKKAEHLVEKFKENEIDSTRFQFTPSPALKNIPTVEQVPSNKYEKKMSEVSGQIAGVTFENVDKKWLQDDNYLYTFTMLTKVIKFIVELQVRLWDTESFEILDILCQFNDIAQPCLMEITPWVQRITKMKNFALLSSAFQQYTEHSMVRNKILESLKIAKYITMNESDDGDVGLRAEVHSPKDIKKPYLNILWSIIFFERTWKIEYCFTITPTNAGVKFAEKNRDLLNDFCEVCITHERLKELWEDLCLALNSYKTA